MVSLIRCVSVSIVVYQFLFRHFKKNKPSTLCGGDRHTPLSWTDRHRDLETLRISLAKPKKSKAGQKLLCLKEMKIENTVKLKILR